MDCSVVMAPVITRLYAEDPVGPALDFMMENHMGLVPVVDRGNKFVGLISGERFMHHLLPHSLMMMRGAKRLSFLQECPEELQERLNILRKQTLGELVDRGVHIAHPATPLADVMKLISEKQFVVPVVEADGTLLGAISFFSLLHWLKSEEIPLEEARHA